MTLDGIKNNLYKDMVAFGEGTKQILSCDRSKEVYGETPQAQARGRGRIIVKNYFGLMGAGLLFNLGLLLSLVQSGGAGNYFLMGYSGLVGALILKEIFIQNRARQKEMKLNNLEENQETFYSPKDYLEELKALFDKHVHNLPGPRGVI